MSNTFDSLSDEDVRQIALLVETLDRSTFDYLQVDVGDMKVTIGKGTQAPGAAPGLPAAAVPAASASVASPPAKAPEPAAAPAAVAAPTPAAAETGKDAAQDGTVTIVAPLMGRFYAKPEPGAAPFVAVGTEVNPDSTVGLIEVMKVFTAVRAGVSGVVTEICVQDAEFIEYGHVLFRVRPAASAAGSSKGSRKGTRS